jgi:hypothetical protein
MDDRHRLVIARAVAESTAETAHPPAWIRDCAQEDTVGEGTLVGHEKERRRRDARFASSPMARANAGRGHRRGLDGPTMPNTLKQLRGLFPRECGLPTRHAWHGEAGESVL